MRAHNLHRKRGQMAFVRRVRRRLEAGAWSTVELESHLFKNAKIRYANGPGKGYFILATYNAPQFTVPICCAYCMLGGNGNEKFSRRIQAVHIILFKALPVCVRTIIQ